MTRKSQDQPENLDQGQEQGLAQDERSDLLAEALASIGEVSRSVHKIKRSLNELAEKALGEAGYRVWKEKNNF